MQKILVIEDDASLRGAIQKAVRMKGFEPLEADSGATGVQMARLHLPDLIITDINMERGDGYQALATLRADPLTAAIPVILMTGLADQSGMRRGMESGADDYLAKPFTLDALFAAIAAQLKKREAVKLEAERKLANLRTSIGLMLPHELNTPLVGILGYGEILSTCAATLPVEQLTEIGQNITASGQRLQRVIRNFLTYSQIELLATDLSKMQALRRRQTPQIRDLITRLALDKAQALRRSEDLQLDLKDSPAAIATDFLEKLVEELLDNAFKFSPPGSPVGVLARTAGDELHLSFSDQGHGMTAEHIAQVGAYSQFERKIH